MKLKEGKIMVNELTQIATKEICEKSGNQLIPDMFKTAVKHPLGTGVVALSISAVIVTMGCTTYKIIEITNQTDKTVKVDLKNKSIESRAAS